MTADQQRTLPGLALTRRRRTTAGRVTPAALDPVARVLLDLPWAHLDRDFDYLVPEPLAQAARPGARIRVRFGSRDVDGFVLDRVAAPTQPGGTVDALTPIRRVVSPEPVLHPEIADLVARLARRYAGTRADLLRLAIPPRHAATEAAAPGPATTPPEAQPAAAAAAWSDHLAATAFLNRLAAGQHPRAVWTAPPGTDWPLLVGHAAAVAAASGQGTLICLPDRRAVDRVDAALHGVLGPGRHVTLTADAGPAVRYREFLAVSRGEVSVVAGTRAAAFAPVSALGLVVIWDDGDDSYAEPRAPYPHAREVLIERAAWHGAAALIGGFACSVDSRELLRRGWAKPLAPPRATVRARVQVDVAGATATELDRDPGALSARIPSTAHTMLRAALATGPVLVQTARRGYLPALACARCRAPARCSACAGPLSRLGPEHPPACAWCGSSDWVCPDCGEHRLRAPVAGERRTAEELGRAFPSIPVRTSGGDRVRAAVPDRPAIVVATPGAEPVADGGYGAVVILDAWLALGRADLRAPEEAVRRWFNAAALVRPGGRVLIVGDPAAAAVQALVRWDPVGFADREAAARAAVRLPPASRLATLSGTPGAVADAVTILRLPEPADLLGPVPVPASDRVQMVVRVPATAGAALADALSELQRLRSARKLDPVRVQLDPLTL